MEDVTIKTLILGLGNPILGDDGVGWHVAEALQKRLIAYSQWQMADEPSAIGYQLSAIEVDCFALGGLSLMERLIGYDRAILIDAVIGDHPPGAVTCRPLEALPNQSSAHTHSAHDTSLQNALQLGRQMGAHLPDTVIVVGIEPENLYDFSEALTPAVEAAVPRAVEAVCDYVRALTGASTTCEWPMRQAATQEA